MFLKLYCASEGLLKTQIAGPDPVSHAVGLGLGIWLSNKFSGAAAAAADVQAALREPLPSSVLKLL